MTNRIAKLKRLAIKEDNLVEVLSPLSTSDIADRNKDYEASLVQDNPATYIFRSPQWSFRYVVLK